MPALQKVPFLILSTAPTRKEADHIANVLIANRLAACVTVIDNARSVFVWQGKRDKANESLLVIKTVQSRVARIEKEIRRMHSYEVPEIIGWPISFCSKPYLSWLQDSVGS